MSAKNKRPAAAPSALAPQPAPVADPVTAAPTPVPFYERHPKAANAIFVALWLYVAALWLLALDQTFHWGIFGPKIPPIP